MRYDETMTAEARYGNCAALNWGDWDVLWEDSNVDYSGECKFLAMSPDGQRFVYVEWSYGSCSGCDGWEAEGLDDEAVAREMQQTAAHFEDAAALFRYLRQVEGVQRERSDRDYLPVGHIIEELAMRGVLPAERAEVERLRSM